MESVYESLLSTELLKCPFPKLMAFLWKKSALLRAFFRRSYLHLDYCQAQYKQNWFKSRWTYSCHRSLLLSAFHSFSQNITIANSETFINILRSELGMRKIFKTIIENSPSKVIPFVLMGSEHVFSADFSFVCGTALAAITKVEKLPPVRDLHFYAAANQWICS